MGLSLPSLLIFTPTWIDPSTGEDVIHVDVKAAIRNQVGVEFDWHSTSDNPYPIGDYRNVLHQYREARRYFLQGPWSALLTVEHDNLLPDPEAVRRMMETPGDVVYAPYMLRHGMKVLSTWQYINDRNLGSSLSNYKAELKQARTDKVHRVSGAGLGCTLIRRHVLEVIEFTGATDRDHNHCPDLRFAESCLRKRFVSNGRFDVPVLHYHDGKWLHPFQNRRDNMRKYTAVKTVRSYAAGRIVQLRQGQEIELTDEEASELTRVGYIVAAASPLLSPVLPPVIQAETIAPIVMPVVNPDLVQTKRSRRRA